MRKEELHKALMHPEQLSDEQLRELRDTVARFPFFGAAQIALTRAFKARGDIRFTDQLSQASIYTGHRASLYNRLKSINQARQEPFEEQTGKTQVTGEPTLATMILDNEILPQETSDVKLSVPNVVESAVHIANVPENAQRDSIASTATINEEEHGGTLRMDELDPLEAQFIVAAVTNSIELEVRPVPQDETEAEPWEPTFTEETDTVDENSYAALIYRRAQQKHLLPETKTPSEEPLDEQVAHPEDLPAFRSTPLSHGIQRMRSTDAKQHQRDLIDRFIHTEPQIARGKAGDYPTGNIAKDSLEEDFSFVTETMAILFAKQGKLDKARKAFRKLMEQHPEKSIYFAAQLKNLDHFKK
jgi:hypothetical protein